MSKKLLALGVALACSGALAQPRGNGPCGGYMTRYWVPQPVYIDGIYVGPIGGSFGTGDGGGGGTHGASGGPGGGYDGLGGGGDGKALLILAVVAVAALPVVLYAVDQDASGDLVQCWAMPTEQFQFQGGAVSGPGYVTGFGGFRFGFGASFFGLEATAEGGPLHRDLAASFAIRAVPKQHVDLALALGGRQVLDSYGARSWFEVALPHRYSPFRADAYNPGVALELRPAIQFGSGAIDARIDGAVVIPFGPWAQLSLGARVFSMQSQLRTGGLLAFQINL